MRYGNADKDRERSRGHGGCRRRRVLGDTTLAVAGPRANAVFAAVGIWAADRTARLAGSKDPRHVVVDEIAGQLVTLAFLPLTPRVLIAGFLVFRVLDVWKPWPADRLEGLPGGSGIMADDLMAGLYGNLILQAIAAWRPAWLGIA